MNEYVSYGLVALTSFFTLINPLGTMPVFMTMTSDLDNATRFKTARKAVIVAFFTLIAFAFSGELLFNFFGISVNALRIVGGIIFFLMGQDMLQARLAKTKVNDSDVKSYVNDISVTPLAIPMICGPGAITNAIILMEDAKDTAMQLVLIGVIAIILSLTLIILWSSSKVMKWLGDTGNKVMMRLMGLIVMVIAVEFFFSGLTQILQEIFNITPAS